MSEIDEKEIKRRFEVISQFEPGSEDAARDVGRDFVFRHAPPQGIGHDLDAVSLEQVERCRTYLGERR